MVDTNSEHEMWTVPHCWIADTMVVCHRWRFPKGPLQSSKYHSLWWTSCTWCFLAASSEWAASSSHRPDDVNENKLQPNISAVGKYTKTYEGKKGKITISLVSQMILPEFSEMEKSPISQIVLKFAQTTKVIRDLNMNTNISHQRPMIGHFCQFLEWHHWYWNDMFYPVVISAVNVSWHPEIPDLHHQPFSNQTVPGGQISVDKMKGSEVHHARGNLSCDVEHLRKGQLTHRRNLHLVQDTSIWTVSPVQTQHT